MTHFGSPFLNEKAHTLVKAVGLCVAVCFGSTGFHHGRVILVFTQTGFCQSGGANVELSVAQLAKLLDQLTIILPGHFPRGIRQ